MADPRSSETRLADAVERVRTALIHLERNQAQEERLSPAQVRLLSAVGRASVPLRVGELARSLGVAISTMTRNVGVLERRGWLERITDDEDRRAVGVRLTPTGLGVVERLTNSARSMMRRAVDTIHPSDRGETAAALARVARALEGARRVDSAGHDH